MKKILAFTLAEGATHVVKSNYKRYLAFTLAEVLVTIGIIGVIAAITVPSVHGEYKKKGYATTIRKIYNDFDTAVDTYITEEGKTSFSATGANTAAGFEKFMNTKFNVIKTCPSANASKCFAPTYKSINGSETKNIECSQKSYALANSAVVCPKIQSSGTVSILLDINGSAGPNLGGRDMFKFNIDKDGKVGAGNMTGETVKNDTPVGDMMPVDMDIHGCAYFAFGDYCIRTLETKNWVMDY